MQHKDFYVRCQVSLYCDESNICNAVNPQSIVTKASSVNENLFGDI